MMKPKRSSGDDRPGGETGTTYCVLGGGHLGAAIARRLRKDDHTVVLVDDSNELSETPVLEEDPVDIRVLKEDPADIRVLQEAGVSAVSTVIVATQSDSRNLLIAQLVRVHFDVPEIVVVANVPERLDPIAEAGHEPVCATSALSEALVDST